MTLSVAVSPGERRRLRFHPRSPDLVSGLRGRQLLNNAGGSETYFERAWVETYPVSSHDSQRRPSGVADSMDLTMVQKRLGGRPDGLRGRVLAWGAWRGGNSLYSVAAETACKCTSSLRRKPRRSKVPEGFQGTSESLGRCQLRPIDKLPRRLRRTSRAGECFCGASRDSDPRGVHYFRECLPKYRLSADVLGSHRCMEFGAAMQEAL